MKAVIIKNSISSPSLTIAAICLGLFFTANHAKADTFSVQYFAAPSGSVDFYNGGTPTGASKSFVLSTLGPNGLPVFNTSYTPYAGVVQPPSSAYLDSSNELLYWTPGAVLKSATGPSTMSLSSTPTNMYAAGQTNDLTYEETAILTGEFNLATTSNVQFSVTADDLAFVYVDNILIDSIGGIHSSFNSISNTVSLGAGEHSIEIFYADLDTSAANLSFSETPSSTPITINPVPEPGTLMMLCTGLLGGAGVIRRRLCL